MTKLIKVTKIFRQVSLNGTFLVDSCFGGVKTVEEENSEGVDYCVPFETSHKVFFLYALEILIKYFLVRSYLIVNIMPGVTVYRPLMDIGYKYNSWEVLLLFSSRCVGSTGTGYTYLSHFPDNFQIGYGYNRCKDHILSEYFI